MAIDKKEKIAVTPMSLTVAKISSVLFLVMHIVCFYLFIDGVAVFYGKTMDLGYSIEIIFDITRMSNFLYRGIFGAALGGLYVLLFCIILKNIILVSKCCKNVFFKNIKNLETLETLSFKVGDRFMSSCLCMGTFMLLCSWVNDYMLPKNAKIVILCAAVGFVLFRLFDGLISRYTPETLLIQLGYSILFIAIAGLLLIYSKGTAIAEAFDGIKMLTTLSDNKKVFNLLLVAAKPIFFAIITISTLFLIGSATSYEAIQNSSAIATARKVLVTASAFAIFVVFVYMANDGEVELDKIYNLIKPYLSLLLIAISAYVFVKAPSNIVRSSSSHIRMASLGKVDSEGVLRIKDGVDKIPANVYNERRDITAVIIPKSVLCIEAGAFSGCGALEEIHCHVGGKPSGWSNEWDKGFYGTVYWKSARE